MLEAFVQGGQTLMQPTLLLLVLIGVLLGIVIGVIPAIGSMFGLAVLLPLVFRMPPEYAMGFLMSMAAISTTGGAITTILLGIPGDTLNAAIVLDGFAMTQKGEAARALGAALTSSVMGGIGAIVLALVMVPLITPLVMAFKIPEMLLLIVLGLAFMATLTGGSVVRGLISGLLGVMLALVGTQHLTGTQRFTFGSLFLYEGLDLVAVVLGLFGVASLIEVMGEGQVAISDTRRKVKLSAMLVGARDVLRHGWLWFRCTVIGYIVGVIPGVGGSVAIWLAYGQAKQTSRSPETFGKGNVEGVIAPSAAHNAKEGGGLLTTMVFGIPGTPEMAIVIGAFLLVGVTPGPSMVKEHLPLAFTLLMGIALANVIGGIICFFTTPYLARMASISNKILFPLIMLIIFLGAYPTKLSMANLLVTLLFGILGYLMLRFGYSRPSLILGFVLGNLFENYLYQAIKIHGPLFFMTPISLGLLALLAFLFAYPYLKTLFKRTSAKEAGKT